jgi:hypothetical protein
VGESSFINMLIYGDPGCGKTTLIGSGGKKYKTLIIRPPTDHVDPIVGSGVKETVVHDWNEMLDVQEYLRHEGAEWDWVWLDSISLFQDTGLDDRFAAAVENKPSRSAQGPDKPEYRVNMWRLEQLVRHTVGAQLFNFGVTAHPFWTEFPSNETPEEAVEKLMPWIQGQKMPQKISGYMNVVGYMSAEEKKVNDKLRVRRYLHTAGNQYRYGKDQFNALGGVMIDPTMPDIMDAITDKRASKKSSARRPTRRPTTRSAGSGPTRKKRRTRREA